MRSERVLIGSGVVCVLVAGSILLGGATSFPWFALASLGLGAIMLVVGLTRTRGRSLDAPTHDPARGERLTRIAFRALVALAVGAAVTAILVAVGEARGHAVFHLLTGIVCLCLFAALAFPWHPTPGSGKAILRGVALSLLALAALGSFVESFGGSGYDAANVGRRIPMLAALHSVGLSFGAFVMVGVPLGIVTGIAVLFGHVLLRRDRVGSAP